MDKSIGELVNECVWLQDEVALLTPIILSLSPSLNMEKVAAGGIPKASCEKFREKFERLLGLEKVKAGSIFSYVITVCDEASAEQCPVFPGITRRLHWSFPDPAAVTGTTDEKLEKVRKIRDDIKSSVEAWCRKMRASRGPDS